MKKENIWKHLRVDEEVHSRVKSFAAKKGMSINLAVIYLLEHYEEYNEVQKNKISDYRKGK